MFYRFLFFWNECIIVKSYLCVAGTEVVDGTVVETKGKKFFLFYIPSL